MLQSNENLIDGDLYCTLYVDTHIEQPGFVILINDFLNGKIFLRNIDNDYLSLSVMKNEDYDPIKKDSELDDAFLYYRYYLDVDPSDNVNRETFVQQLRFLINFLRKNGFKTQPVCDFENELNDINNASSI
jgi:hypothetical protein